MPDYSKMTACVRDFGLYVSLARTLAPSFGRMLYSTPYIRQFALINEKVIGDGYPEIETVRSFDKIEDQVDIFIYPDVQFGEEQERLRRKGKLVFGGGTSDELELNRQLFRKTLKKIGLNVVPAEIVVGMTNLRLYLMEHEDVFVKIDRWRGTMETWHSESYELSRAYLDDLASALGPLQDKVPFIVEEPIDGVEIGYDGYSILGQFPKKGMIAYEVKDAGMIGTIKPYDSFPDSVKEVNSAFAPLLKKRNHRGLNSTEIRVQKDGEFFFTDPCQRAASPGNEIYQAAFSNLAEIIVEGAKGICIDPVETHEFGVCATIHSGWAEKHWLAVQFPDDIDPFVKLRNSAFIDGMNWIVPHEEYEMPQVGCVVGLGDTLLEAIQHCQENADQIKKNDDITIRLDALANAIDVIKEGQDAGVWFTDEKLPTREEIAA